MARLVASTHLVKEQMVLEAMERSCGSQLYVRDLLKLVEASVSIQQALLISAPPNKVLVPVTTFNQR